MTINNISARDGLKYAVGNTFFFTLFFIFFYVKMPDDRSIIESQIYLWGRKCTLFLTH